jgi:hypothetical protein
MSELRSFIRCLCRVALVAVLAACTAPERTAGPDTGEPRDFPGSDYRVAAKDRDNRVFQVDGPSSILKIGVHRAGTLATLGHDHVIASHQLGGFLLVNQRTGECRADLYAPVAGFTVDEPALRRAAGLENTLTSADIEGTRSNLLDRVLTAGEFPFIEASIRRCDPAAKRVTATFRVRGQPHPVADIPIELRVEETQLSASGAFTLNQTAIGITPFSTLGGLLQVDDRMDIAFELRARRLTAAE